MPAAIDRHLPLKAVHFHILLSLVEGPAHGYGVKREVEERTEGQIGLSAGTLYETIQRLERNGLIAETVGQEESTGGTSRWRFYEATELGRNVLDAEVVRLEADVAVARTKLRRAT